ncbi:MAG TPA: AraC family transcriptional regulator [Pirellulales bacterium]|nr:AraC family transcriptional regulator [Pirellulales bacterium]
MPRTDPHLSETDIRPAMDRVAIVRADEADPRAFLASGAVCGALGHVRIRHLAAGNLPCPFRIVRTKLGGTFFLACYGGEGRVLVDGRWKVCRAGQAALLPPGTLHAFHTAEKKSWDICWVRYQESPGQKPLAAVHSPLLAQYDPEPLRLAILGLHRECTEQNTPALLERWVELIHAYVLRFAQPASLDPRLWELWTRVAEKLAQPWSVATMAHAAHLGEKQLQRLCRRELGRTPRQQLIWLRMRRAAELLTSTGGKIETIAAQVGYDNAFVFSSTFKRVMGFSPSEYPGRRQLRTTPVLERTIES